jgi:hypothetical protein
MDIFMYCMIGFVGIVVGAAILYCLYYLVRFLYRVIFFNLSYGEIKESEGKITNMEYEASHYNPATKTTDSEKNYVYFKTPQGSTCIDSDTLYQRVRVGEGITVRYQERSIKPKYWNGDWKFDGFRLLTITSKLSESVEFNSEKPVRRGF